ncbi:MAG: hypothetical protein LBQ14_06630 [Treponema sp.]|nr:hypothetical protein [Treponema sp.]
METDKAAGIILDEKQEKDAFFNGLFNVLFKGQAGQRVSYKYLYAVKGRGDRSLLIVKHNFSYDEELFCAEEEFSDSRNYYNDIDNYGLVVSKSGGNAYIFDDFYYIDGKETVSRPLSKDSFGILTGNGEKDNYRGNGILIPNSFTPKGRGYTYINIYGISGDGVYKKLLRHYIVDNDDIYYADAYNIVDISVVKLYADEKAFLLSLLE